ncbi:STAS domain-containing protein [Streptomyces sp. NPDC050625]|uniref:STAS domain-containing protein n=1 Tax=Streptomyces sp. NPDC050625 TaxID=3154629 RepID=UPI0034240E5B
MTPDADDRGTRRLAGAESPLARPPAPNSCARTRTLGPVVVIEAYGEIDIATADLLGEHLDAATAGPEPDVLVDLRSVDFFDCSGLRVLCRAETRARERGGRLRLVGVGTGLQRLLRGAGLLERFRPLPRIPGERP